MMIGTHDRERAVGQGAVQRRARDRRAAKRGVGCTACENDGVIGMGGRMGADHAGQRLL